MANVEKNNMGEATISVNELIALNNSVSQKDQTIGELRARIANYDAQIRDLKTEFEEKQKLVRIDTIELRPSTGFHYCNRCDYSFTGPICPNCGYERELVPSTNTTYRNLDETIELIRKEEATRLSVDVVGFENRIQQLTLAKMKVENDLNFKTGLVQEKLDRVTTERENDIKKRIADYSKTYDDTKKSLNEKISELKEELKKVKENTTDAAIEEARKKEIIDLKERITELEQEKDYVPEYGWFKMIFYNWLKVDMKAKEKAFQSNLVKQERVKNISRDYPNNKNWWVPGFMQDWHLLNYLPSSGW